MGACQAMCNQSASCSAWIFLVHSPPPGYGPQPSGAGDCEFRPPDHGCQSKGKPGQDIYAGVKLSALKSDCASHTPATDGTVDTLQLLPADTEIDIRVFFDNDFAEVYFMQGRVVMS